MAVISSKKGFFLAGAVLDRAAGGAGWASGAGGGGREVGGCLVRDIKNRILQLSNCPILEFKVLQNAFKIKLKSKNKALHFF